MKDHLIPRAIDVISKLSSSEECFKVLKELFNNLLQAGDNDDTVLKFQTKLRELGVDEELFSSSGTFGLSLALYQLLGIHFLLHTVSGIDRGVSLESLIKQLEESKHPNQSKIIPQYLIIYQEYFEKVTWHDYLKTASLKTRAEINSFRSSIPFCKIITDDIVDIIARSAHNFPNDNTVHALAYSLSEKVYSDLELKQEVSTCISALLTNKDVYPFTHRFLYSIVDNDEQIYLDKFEVLQKEINKENSVPILKALELATPNEEIYVGTYLPLLHEQLTLQHISRADYLNLASTKQVNVQATHEFALEVARTLQNTGEGHAVLSYLSNFRSFADSGWFQEATEAVFKYPDGELTAHLNEFVYDLADQDSLLLYKLMTARFEALGGKYFLENAGTHMAENRALFSQYLTQWFLSDMSTVHLAMRRLCSVHSIPSQYYQLSEGILASISASEKLFIALKIAGYVYTREPLQNLILSLTNSIHKSDKVLLDNLSQIYDQYIIYNYRSTLDNIKEQLKRKDLPKHLRTFYTNLRDTYDAYFEQLQSIPNLMELSADFTIAHYYNFYEQAMFQKIQAQTEKPRSLSMFKPIKVKSPRWAIRRPNELRHEVREMGHYESSTEFPMGEKLDPIFQEKIRRHYQSIKKDEINID